MAKKKKSGSVKLVYDYYTVRVSGDVYDLDYPSAMEELGQLAIEEARERTRLWCFPALWVAEPIAGELGDYMITFRVRRTRRKVAA